MSDTVGYPDPGLDLTDGFKPHTSHWGVFSARHGEAGLEVRPYGGDPDPSGIVGNFPGALRHQARIAQPAIRDWLFVRPGVTAFAATMLRSIWPRSGRKQDGAVEPVRDISGEANER